MSVNLIWLSLSSSIFGGRTDKAFFIPEDRAPIPQSRLDHLMRWSASTLANINLWYDSRLLSQNHHQYYLRLNEQKIPNLFFRDIATDVMTSHKTELDYIPIIMRGDDISLGYAVDLAKWGIAQSYLDMQNGIEPYIFLYVDFDFPPFDIMPYLPLSPPQVGDLGHVGFRVYWPSGAMPENNLIFYDYTTDKENKEILKLMQDVHDAIIMDKLYTYEAD